ncbi:MAG: hypothetical protein SPJ55_11050 [Treponema sp.]|nr:hypothetical protein [Treponema sp.]
MLFLIFALSLIPYVPIPKEAINAKYETTELAKLTLPIPSGERILDTYGKVINGNRSFIKVLITFRNAFFLMIYLP